MAMLKERRGRGSSVPQFGGWDTQNQGDATNYSMVFSQARANRKQQKHDLKHSSLGSDKELMAAAVHHDDQVMRRWKIFNCFWP